MQLTTVACFKILLPKLSPSLEVKTRVENNLRTVPTQPGSLRLMLGTSGEMKGRLALQE